MNKFKQLYNNTRKIILDGETLYPAKLKDMTIEKAISAKRKEIECPYCHKVFKV